MAHDTLTEQQAFMILNDLPNIGPISLNRLLAEFGGDPVAILRADRRRLESVRGIGPESSAALAGWTAHFDLAREEERLAQAGASFITARDPGYPPLLKEISDPPIGLYRKGTYEFGEPCIAIVGSRRTTLYGQAVAKKLGAELARLGFCVTSGLARGIDTAAHEGALSVNGKTAAVLGTGIDIIYPSENLDLYRRIAESGGAVLSEFPFGRKADRQGFVGNLRREALGRQTCLSRKRLYETAPLDWRAAQASEARARNGAEGRRTAPRNWKIDAVRVGTGPQAAARAFARAAAWISSGTGGRAVSFAPALELSFGQNASRCSSFPLEAKRDSREMLAGCDYRRSGLGSE